VKDAGEPDHRRRHSRNGEAGSQAFLPDRQPACPHAPWESGEPYYSLHPRPRIELPANRRAVEPADKSTAAWRFGQLLGDVGMREYVGVYYGLVAMMDWNVGRLLDSLRRLGLERDTRVIFGADHGDIQGGHGCYDKSTFSMYEETTRVPLRPRDEFAAVHRRERDSGPACLL
jgi:arylsulfatase A-like enzyme